MRLRVTVLLLACALIAPLAIARPAAALSPHPRLLFSTNEVAAVRAKVLTGQPKLAWEYLRKKADAYVDPLGAFYVDPANPYIGEQNRMGTHLVDLAFAFVVSGDTRYSDHVEKILLSLAATGWPSWNDNELGEGDLMKGVGLAYDWIRDQLTASERLSITSSLVAQLPTLDPVTGLVTGGAGQEKPKRFSCLDEDWFGRSATSNNWFGVCGGGSGLALLAIEGEPGVPDLEPYLQVARGRVLGAWNGMFSPQGDNTEGILYAAYSNHNALPFSFAWERSRGEDLAGLVPGVAEHVMQLAYEQIPGHAFWFANRNDSMYLSGVLDETMPLLLEARTDGVADWLWDNTVGPAGVDTLGKQPALYTGPNNFPENDGSPCNSICYRPVEAFTILYYRSPAERPRVHPGALHGQVRHYEKFGLVDVRTGFGPAAANLALTYEAKRNHHMAGHFQRDGGHFNLYAYGDKFAIDSGYGHDYTCAAVSAALYGCSPTGDRTIDGGRAIGHSVPLVDGQAKTQDGSNPASSLQTLPLVVDAPTSTVIRSNLQNAYGVVQRARRDLILTRAPGEPVLLAVGDALQKHAATPVQYQWRLNTDPANTLVFGNEAFTIRGASGATLTGAVAAPAARVIAPTALVNGYESAAYHLGVASHDATFTSHLALDHLSVMALTAPGAMAPTLTKLPATGGSVIRADFASGGAYVATKTVGASAVQSGTVLHSDGEIAKLSFAKGETVLAAGTTLSTDQRSYVKIVGTPSSVVVSGPKVIATGATTNLYRVYAPQTITGVTLNATAVTSCREGVEIVFPCP